MSAPLISVVMSVKDGEKYVKDTVDSILNQTLTNFEFIIINDGSSDKTTDILNAYVDDRITIVTHKEPHGIPRSLNEGLRLAQGQYIARMDGDDICEPNRFEVQVAHMEKNSKCVVLGASYYLMDENGHSYRKAYSNYSDAANRFMLMYNYPFCNPSLMLRRETLVQNDLFYSENMAVAEDHEFLMRLAQFGEIECTPEYLFHYRTHAGGISKAKKELITENTVRICEAYISEHYPNHDIPHLDLTWLLTVCTERITLTSWSDIERYLKTNYQLVQAFIQAHPEMPRFRVEASCAETLFKKVLFKDKNIKRPLNMIRFMISRYSMFSYFMVVMPKFIGKMMK